MSFLGPAMPFISAVSSIASIAGAAQQSYARYDAIRSSEELARRNARIAETDARAAAASSRMEQDQFQRRLALLQGQQRARLTKAGVTLDDGSPLLVQEDLAAEGELEALALRLQGETAVRRHLDQAGLDRFEADRHRASRAGYVFGAATSLLSSLDDVFSPPPTPGRRPEPTPRGALRPAQVFQRRSFIDI